MSPAVPTAPIAPLSLTRSDGGVLTLDGSRCVIMGILNLTPDSFSDGGRLTDVTAALRHAERLVAEGAAILDFGAESTRPGAERVVVAQELDRVIPVVEGLARLSTIRRRRRSIGLRATRCWAALMASWSCTPEAHPQACASLPTTTAICARL